METIKVKFYLEDDGHVLAYFPFDYYNGDNYTRTCYCHIGQHSACVPDYVSNLQEANPEQYKDLYSELLKIGYLPQVIS
jgi:hypothetical protein